MPKLKTNRAASKRFRRLKSGKIRRWQAMRRHLLTGKGRGRKRTLRRSALVQPADQKAVQLLLPYG